jgi:hypothetical protein
MTLTLACVLRSGGDYTPEHVEALRRALPGREIFCFTDMDVSAPTIPLAHDWRSWWAKLELCDVSRLPGLQSAVMYLPEAARGEMWGEWLDAQSANPMGYMQSDQTFMDERWRGTARRWQDELPGQFVSYKVHCSEGVPNDARVVVFHGTPRPWDTPLWKAAA